MKLPEYRKLIKGLSDEKKEQLILDLYKRAPKTEKQLQEIIADQIRQDKELPPAKAMVPDLKAAQKELDKLKTMYYRYCYGRRFKSANFRKSARKLLQELPLCPVQAEQYDEAVELLVKLYDLCCEDDRHLRSEFFSLAGITRSNFYALICNLMLARGYKKETLERLIQIPAHAGTSDGATVTIDYQRFISLLKNGDLRLEVIELCEELIKKYLYESKEAQKACEYTSDRRKQLEAMLIGICWYMLDKEEAGETAAKQEAEKLFGPELAANFLSFFSEIEKYLNEKERAEQKKLEDQFDDYS